MRLIGKHNDKLVLHLGRREKDLLVQLFSLYPLMPSGGRKLSRKSHVETSNQQLLDESLTEERAEHQERLAALLADPERWSEQHQGWKLSVATGEIEWLLQVLNDIRVGSWISLGSPENTIEAINEETAPHLWAMEIAGSFQMTLLHILESPDKT